MNDIDRVLAGLSSEKRAHIAQRLADGSGEFNCFPLSLAQQRLWFISQLQSDDISYNISLSVRVAGRLDVDLLSRCFSEIIERHETLRTVFASVDGVPAQIVTTGTFPSIPLVDLMEHEPSNREREALRLIAVEAADPFDLRKGPLFRVKLLRLGAEEHVVVVVMHHIISDGWSSGILIREIRTLYEAYGQGLPSPLPELAIQYADYSLWQRGWLQGEVLDRQVSYWKERLSGAPAALELPTDHARLAIPSYKGRSAGFRLSADLTRRLRELVRREGATLFMVLLAGFQLLLKRYSGQDDIVVGSPIAGRTNRELEGLIGFFVNTLALRTNLGGDPSFNELLGRVKENTLEAYAHQDLPFEKLVAELQPVRDLSRQPVFQVLFALQNLPQQTLELPGLRLSRMSGEQLTSKFDLSLYMQERGDRLEGQFEYATDLFERSTIVRMVGHLQVLLEAIVAAPHARLSELDLLTEAERRQLLEGWNDTTAYYPRDKCLHELFAEQAARTPDAVALVYQDSELSYCELDRSSNQLAHHLRSLGVGPETIVGLCVERSPEMVIGLLGILKAGGAYLPLDPNYPPERLAYMVADADAAIVVTQARLIEQLPKREARVVQIDTDWHEIVAQAATAPRNTTLPDNLAYVLYTSGSTGRPKGVSLQHASAVAMLSWAVGTFSREDTASTIASTSICFDLSVFELFVPLCSGGRVILANSPVDLPTAAKHATLINTVPSAIAELIRRDDIFDAISVINLAGEPLQSSLVQQLYNNCNVQRVYNLYGPSEDTTYSTYALIDRNVARVPIGRPISNTRTYVLDAGSEVAPIGVSGELYIGGVGLARGYLNRPELTADRFVPSPFGDGERLYRTGDLVRYLPDGNLEYLGRIDHQVKLRGYRIELGEIEAVLAEHAAVHQAVVVAREDTPGDKRLVAYVVGDETQLSANSTPDKIAEEWGAVFDLAYQGSDGRPSFTGWNSSYTGQPIPEAEMQEWLATTVERIGSLQPARLLEIGCGIGLLVQHLAPRCEVYQGIDISASAIESLQRWSAQRPELRHVKLSCRGAADLNDLAPKSFDTVVLNSVVQYFPDVDYLLQVMTRASELVAPGGRIFVGDVRHLGLLPTFRGSIQLSHASAETRIGQLRSRIAAACAGEKELVLDPEFFDALQDHIPRIGGVEILLRRGRSDNELTRYRYDVVLHIDRSATPAVEEEIDWTAQGNSLVDLAQELGKRRPAAVRINNIPNLRLARDVAIARLLGELDDGCTVADLRRGINRLDAEGEDPDAFHGLAESWGYQARIGWSADRRDGRFDVVLVDHTRAHPASAPRRRAMVPQRPLATYATAPSMAMLKQHLIPQLRELLRQRLPDYMMPAAFVALNAMLLTPNGKIDRRALPAPEGDAVVRGDYLVPRTPTEEMIASLWCEVLKLERVGVHDNFFELGGHSLSVLSVVERMRRAGLHVDVRALFSAPNLAALAAAVGSDDGMIEVPPNLIPLQCENITPEMLPLVQLSEEEIESIQGAVPGGGSNIQDIYPLAPLQEGILFHHLMAHEGDPYLMEMLLRFDGRTRLDAYLQALQQVISRHDILRTAVRWEGLTEPVQVVVRKAPLIVHEVTIDPGATDIASELRSRFNPRHYRIDVRQAPLVQLFIAKDTRGGGWLLLHLYHHLTIDHATLELLRNEIAAHLQGQTATLPVPPSFRNFVAQARLGVSREEHEAFFRGMLSDIDAPTAPFGLIDVSGDAGDIVESQIAVDELLAKRLRAQARWLRVSCASLFHLAWAQVLARASGRNDVVFGTVLFGRMQGGVGADRALGMFINTLPVRISVGDDGAKHSVLQVHRTLTELMRHEHAPLNVAQRCSGVKAPTPLFSALLNYRYAAPQSSAAVPQWKGVQFLKSGDRTNFPITFTIDDLSEKFLLTAQVQSGLDAVRVCRFMHQALDQLVEALESAPAAPLCSLDVLPPSERRRLVVEWNDTVAEYPREKCLHELFAEQAAKTPDAIAVVYEHSELSYGELDRRSNQLAHHLRGLGVGPEAIVGLCVERSLEMVIGLLGILKAGGAYLALDPSYPTERLAYMLEDAEVRLVLTAGAAAPALARDIPVLRLDADAAAIATYPMTAPDQNGVTPDNLAYVLYTSGSTGKPKGVMGLHQGMVNRIAAQDGMAAFDAGDICCLKTSISFADAIFEVLGPLSRGLRLVVADAVAGKDAAALASLIKNAGVTRMVLVPSLASALMSEVRTREQLSGLRVCTLSGEALSEKLLRQLVEGLPGCRFVNLYGSSEVSADASCYVAGAWTGGVVPIGRPVSNMQLYVLDGGQRTVPIGVSGELYIGGVGLARGYLHRPELTAERFVPSPFAEGERLYRTGDLVRYLPDGNLEFLGRIDHQVKIRGHRIELGEIEAGLLEHPAVNKAVVTAREDVVGDKRLVAYVVRHDGAAVDASELRAHLKRNLPDYMGPSAFVLLEALPLTPSGKVDRRAMPVPEDDAIVRSEYVAPRTPVEEMLAGIWREVLKLDRVGVHDNFFELGGHSLLMLKVLERMRQDELYVDVRALFNTPTLAALAAAVEVEDGAVEVPPNLIPLHCEKITPEMLPLVQLSAGEIARIADAVAGGAANIQDIYPLAPLQEGILFHHLLAGEGDIYLMDILLRLEDRARLDRYLQALQQVIDRHDILRTAIRWEGLSEPVQVVLRHAPLHIHEVSFDPSGGEIAVQLRNRFNSRNYRIDIGRAPLLHLFVAKDSSRDGWLLLHLFHHVTMDHTALEIVRHEVAAHLGGESAKLPVSLPFRNFVAQARLGIAREEHEAFFRQMLGDVVEPTAPFGLIDVYGERINKAAQRALDEGFAKRLRSQARLLRVSSASICHVASALVLARLSGRKDVVFGTLLFGRMQGKTGMDRAPGLFINMLPFRVSIDDRSVRDSILNVHRGLTELLRHEHASLSLAQRCSGVPSPMPLFSAVLNYRYTDRAAWSSAGAPDALKGVQILAGGDRNNYPMMLTVDDFGDDFLLSAQVRSGLDPVQICDLFHRALDQLVDALERLPATAVRSLDVLLDRERRRLVEEWNATAADYPKNKCLHALFEEQAARTPDAVAVVCEGRQLSYRELDHRSNQLAYHLRGLDVGPETIVGLCVERSPEMVIGLLGILKAGGAYLPLDPGYPAERLAYMAVDARIKLVLTAGAAASAFPAGADVALLRLDADAETIAGHPIAPVESGVMPQNLAYVIYTSGSTGRPKGVGNHHCGIVNRLLWMQDAYCLDASDRVLQKTPFSFDVSVWEFFWPLLFGAQLVVARPEGHRDPIYLAELIESQGATIAHFVPSMLQVFLNEANLGRCGSLRDVICSGEALAVETKNQFLGNVSCRLHNLYGPTEAAVDVSAWPCTPEATLVSIGRPISNMQLYVLDGDQRPVPICVSGELHIGGIGLARGYLNRPELTAERFVPSPFAEGERLYRTGDLVRYLPEGNLEYLGRIDHQVKIRGYRIELGEIEAVLAGHEAVAQAVVVVREDVPGDKRLVAYIIGSERTANDAGELRAHLKSRLPDYMVPSAFVVLDALPLTPNGKIDRKALPAPEGEAVVRGAYVAPRTQTEETIATAWCEVLKLDRVGVHDNFFELGGHSLLATRLVAGIRDTFGVELPLRALFEAPTIAELSERLDVVRRTGGGLAVPSLGIQPRSGILPLSFAQERLWLLEQIEGLGAAYNMPAAVRLRGRLDIAALERSFAEVVRRHESLRTRFGSRDGQGVQVIDQAGNFELEVIDLTATADAKQREAEARKHAGEEVSCVFDLVAGPLLRAQLLRLAADDHIAVVVMHHIVSDGWSIGVLIREIGALYEAYSQGRRSPLPELAIQYADYTLWQRGWLQGDMLERQLCYWREHLSGAPAALELPNDRPRPAVPSYRGGSIGLVLPADLTRGLNELARREGATLFMVLLAAFDVVLSRWSGQSDIVVGSPIAGRTHRELEGLIGFFVNTLALRTDLSGNPSFSELVARIKETALEGYAHQDLPFEKLVGGLQPVPDLSRQPIFQVLFALQNLPQQTLELPGLRLSRMGGEQLTSKFDLSLYMQERGDRLEGYFEYATDLFERATIARLAGHFRTLLEGTVAAPQAQLSELPLLPEAERRQLLEAWNDTTAAYPREKCLHQLFAEQTAKTPEAIAVVYEDSELSYRELDRRCNQLAHHLQSLGVGPETIVGLCVERSPEMVIGLLGILKAGGAYLPLDPNYPPERLATMLADAKAPVLVTQTRLLAQLPGHDAQLVQLDSDWAEIAAHPATAPDHSGVTPQNLAYVLYTSGSTGKPKGVMGLHQGMVNRIAAQAAIAAFNDGDICCQKTSIGFGDAIFEVLGPLSRGLRLVIASDAVGRAAGELVSLMADAGVTRVVLVPSLASVLVSEAAMREQLSGLQVCTLSGEALSEELLRHLVEALPQCCFVNLYGSSEVSADASCYVAGARMEGPVPIGRPIANMRLYVLDGDHHPVPIGVSGELYIGGVGLARGYLNRPELTADRFVPSPFGDGERLYRTGDLVRYLPDGNLEYLGRIDHQVKLRGYRIELGEIEAVLAEHAAVRQAVVVAREDTPGDKRLVAYVVGEGVAGDVGGLRSHLKNRLPDYMVPAAFVSLDALPLTPNGKIDRKALPAPEGDAVVRGEYVAPRTQTEEAIATVWCEVLKLDRVGVHDNFFELGGHSLLATQVIARIRDSIGVELPLRALFEAPTIAELSERLDVVRRTGGGLVVPALGVQPRPGILPLSYAQERLWVLEQLGLVGSAYNVPAAVRLQGQVDIAALERSFAELVRRHEGLRTRFEVADGTPCQVIDDPGNFALEVIDLTAIADAKQREAEARKHAGEEVSCVFDLENGPLFLARLLRLGVEEHVVIVVMHHIVSDGWSIRVLIREIGALYEAYSQGRPSPLPELAIQYADYALWQRGWLQGDMLERQLCYWREHLSGAPAALELPNDRPRPAVPSYRGGSIGLVLPADLTRGLNELARAEGATLFMVLLAAFDVVLSRWSGQSDIVVGSPIAGRTHRELEGLIGFFVNTLALRTDMSGDPTFRQLLKSVRQAALEGYAHQDLPFEKLVVELQPVRDLSRQPIFQVLFALQNLPQQTLELPGLRLSRMGGEQLTSKFDLSLYMQERGDRLEGYFEYATDLFERATIARLAGHFRTLLEGIVAAPQAQLSELPLLPEAERRQLLEAWNDTTAAYPREKCLHELFAEQAVKTPEAIAVVYEDSELSYRELDRRSNQLAHHLRGLDVGPETIVGLCVERSPEMVIGLLGILKAGGAYLPLDPNYPPERLATMLADAGVRLVLTAGVAASVLPAAGDILVLRLDADALAIAAHPATAPDPNGVTPQNLAYVIYTSGSTGKPKGVMVRHDAVVNFLTSMTSEPGLGASDVLAAVTPLAFDISGLEIYLPLLNGARLCILPRAVTLDGMQLKSRLDDAGATILQATPSAWQILLDAGWKPDRRLKVLCGGEAMPEDLWSVLSQGSAWNLYGPTETTIWSTISRLTAAAQLTIGHPIANTQTYVLDVDLQPVPIGVSGELYIGGAGLARGYLGRPELTADRFVPSRFAEGERLYRSGDLVRWRCDGELEYLGRLDHQVKLRGYRIELGEIEARLVEHPGVHQAVVVAREDTPGEKRLVGYVVAADEAGVDAIRLRDHLKRSLPDYMVPSAFVLLEALPLTPNGKLDRRALPAPDAGAVVRGEDVAPRNPAEEVLASIWCEVLKLDRVGVHDNFFELGGHSLLLVHVHRQLQQKLGTRFSILEFFQYPTIAEMTGFIAAMKSPFILQPQVDDAERGFDRNLLQKAGFENFRILVEEKQ